MVKNFTQGKPIKLIFFFMLPMWFGHMFQQLYNMVDTMVVGKFVGESALAAVGSAFPVVFLAITVAMGMSTGCTVVVSQFFGAQRINGMKTTIYTGLISLTGLGLILMVIGEIVSMPLLTLLGTNADIIDQSLIYLRIYFGGAVFLFLYNTVNSIFHALGDSKTPLIILIISSFTNIVLDLLFVIKFSWGVAGVAWATLISQGMCAIGALYVLMKRIGVMEDPVEPKDAKIKTYSFDSLKMIAKIGIPSMLQQALIAVGNLFVQGLVNSYGTTFVAGYVAANKIDSLAMSPNMNCAIAMSTFSGQNIGARKYDRVSEGFKGALMILAGFSVILFGAMWTLGPQLLRLFLNAGGDAMNYGLSFLKTVSLFYMLMGVLFVGNGLLRGAGDMKSFMLSTTVNLVVRIASAYGLAQIGFIGCKAVWWSIPIGWAAGSAVTYFAVKSGKWKNVRVIRGRAPQKPEAAKEAK